MPRRSASPRTATPNGSLMTSRPSSAAPPGPSSSSPPTTPPRSPDPGQSAAPAPCRHPRQQRRRRPGGPTESVTEAEFDQVFAVNVKVPFFLVAALAPAMAARGQGAIVSTSTLVASFGQPGVAAYGASRAALELLTKAWAAEYGPHGVRVNAVAPGPTRTPMNDAYGDMPQRFAALAPPAASPSPRRSPPPSPTSPATTPASSTAPLSRSTAAAPPPEPRQPFSTFPARCSRTPGSAARAAFVRSLRG